MQVEAEAPDRNESDPLASKIGRRWAFAGLGLLFLIAQLALFRLRPNVSYDEAVYLSQIVRPRHPLWGAHRAWGTSILVAPVAIFGVHIAALRLYLAVVSSMGLALAFGLWDEIVGRAPAILAGVLFGFSWVGLYYGSQAMPNVWTALLGVAAAAFLIRSLRGVGRRANLGLGVTMAGATLMRPSDASILAVGLVIAIFMIDKRRASRPVGSIVAGLAAGWLPWVIESFIEFGGPIQRLRDAAIIGAEGGIRNNLGRYLRSLGGPLLDRVPEGRAPWFALVFALVVIVGAIAAVIVFRNRGEIDAVVACIAGGVFAAVPYVFVAGPTAPRFLLPFWGLLSIPAAALLALAAVRSLDGRSGVALATLSALLVPLLAWQGARAHTLLDQQAEQTGHAPVIASVVRDFAGGRSCELMAPYARAELALYSGCQGQPVLCPKDLVRFRAEHHVILAMAPSSHIFNVEFASWTLVRAPMLFGRIWHLYELKAGNAYHQPADLGRCRTTA